MNWYYVVNGKKSGPFDNDQVADLLRTGKVTLETMVWHDGMTDWQTLKSVQLDLLSTPVAPPIEISEPEPAEPTQPVEPAPKQIVEAVCTECRNLFPIKEMMRHGSVHVCSGCKSAFIEKLSHGIPISGVGELRYAGFWIRLIAKLVDFLFVGAIIVVCGAVVVVALDMTELLDPNNPSTTTPEVQTLIGLIAIIAAILFEFVYQVFFLGVFGATLGKILCRLRVVRGNGMKIGLGRAAARFWAELLSRALCYLGYLIVIFDGNQKRALHDHICNTRVVHK